jgi:hypothetical protein
VNETEKGSQREVDGYIFLRLTTKKKTFFLFDECIYEETKQERKENEKKLIGKMFNVN